MIADFKACGGFLLLATGLRISKIPDFPIADMIPAMVLAMPLISLDHVCGPSCCKRQKQTAPPFWIADPNRGRFFICRHFFPCSGPFRRRLRQSAIMAMNSDSWVYPCCA
jgi:hypothetical protein